MEVSLAFSVAALCGFLLLGVPVAGLAQVVISEFMANNTRSLADADKEYSDWIELYNASNEPVDLNGWYLTDDASALTKWRFPRVTLLPNNYLVVFASEKNRRIAGAELHTNFKLSADGEFLALIKADGVSVASQYGPPFLAQLPEVSYGFPMQEAETALVLTGTSGRLLVPADGGLETRWTEVDWPDADWASVTTGVGFAPSASEGLPSQIKTDIAAAMHNKNSTAYLRIPFTLPESAQLDFLTLRIEYNDGFIAYLNGVEVARRNAPEEPSWDSAATQSRTVSETVQVEEIDLSKRLGLLQTGRNVLAIHGLNASATDSTFLIAPELIATRSTMDTTAPLYFAQATPGAVNGLGRIDLGPVVVEIAHTPRVPSDGQDVIVTARAVRTFDPIAQLTLSYRVMFGAEPKVAMLDDGRHADGAAGDGVYGATIPVSVLAPGQMVRYFITAVDSNGDSTRWPTYSDPRNSPQYFGTMVADPSVASALPVLHWFVQNPRAADSETGTRSSVFFNGEFYDNIGVNLHGQSSSGFPKKSYDFDFNRGHHFSYSPLQEPVEDFNLLTTYPDKAHMRNILAYETYRDAGSTYHVAFPVRVQQNGAFFSDAHFVEDGDEDYLARLGLDRQGALYKMDNTLNSATSGVEKKTRKHEGNADLQGLISGLGRTGAARTRFIYDNVNIPAMANYLAATIITGGVDCCHKNYYAYRDTNGNGEWQYLPWDVDLTFGRNWNSANTYYDDTMFASNPLFVGANNTLISALFATPGIRQMYLRRVRTLMDQLLQSTNTPPEERRYERRINELSTLIAPDAALDFAKWPTWGQKQTLAQAVFILTNQYLPVRRRYLYRLSEIPNRQPTDATLTIGAIEFNPASGNQDEEFIQITNVNALTLDISDWVLTGAVTHRFRPGTVLPARGSIYLSPNVVAFRARKSGPAGGQGLFVQGNYQGQLSARGETLTMVDEKARVVATATYSGAPTPAQQFLRIVEIMYHPVPPPAGSPFTREDFEFLQLKNIGPAALDLSGVRLTDGIDFAFSDSNANRLEPGDSVYVVKNPSAFTSRHGPGFNLVGPYEGNLENRGENLRLDEASGEKVLDFAYSNTWHAGTDGDGFSLMILDENTPWNSWGDKGRWVVGREPGGSPGQANSALAKWKATHFAPNEIADPAIGGDEADPDLDGRNNLEEFISGTDPRNAGSYLRIEAPQLQLGESNILRIRFAVVSLRSYSIQYSDSITSDDWQKHVDIPAENQTRLVEVTVAIEPTQRSRYYRVVTPLQP